MADYVDLESCFQMFTVLQVVSVVGEVIQLPRAAKRNRTVLFDTLRAFPPETQSRLRTLALAHVGMKRKAAKSSIAPRKRMRVDTPESTEYMDVDEQLLDGPFFQPLTKEVTEGAVIR
jgi:hypothetical protein